MAATRTTPTLSPGPAGPERATPAGVPVNPPVKEAALEDIDRHTLWPMHRIRWGLSIERPLRTVAVAARSRP